jgi:ABC-type amino acid transport system permease subunit
MKLIFTATSLAPILFAYAIAELSSPRASGCLAGVWALAGAVLIGVCFLLFLFFKQRLGTLPLDVESVENTDKQMISYIVTYLLPIIARDSMNFEKNLWTASFTLLVLTLCIYHSSAFHFNPVLAFFGYHFYEVKTSLGMPYLYITRRVIYHQKFTARVCEFSDYFYVEAEAPDT